MNIINECKLDFSDVLIVPKRSTLDSRSQVELNRHFKFPNTSTTWSGIPIVAANMDTVGTLSMWDSLHQHNMLTCLSKHYSLNEIFTHVATIQRLNSHQEFVAISTGIKEDDLERMYQITDAFPAIKFICIDVANGYTESFVTAVSQVREKRPNHIIIAGNVVTPSMAEVLIIAGADIVKVGIGSGAVCTTRLKTGVGYPQLSAIIETADAVHGLKGHVMSDGGCVVPGDISKAFGAGADFVMLGGMLAGHDEAGVDNFVYEGINFVGVRYYGMSSEAAMNRHSGGVAGYRTSEGKEVCIPYKGSVHNTVQDILGGVRSTCTYIGASSLKEVPKRTTFIRTGRQYNNAFDKY